MIPDDSSGDIGVRSVTCLDPVGLDPEAMHAVDAEQDLVRRVALGVGHCDRVGQRADWQLHAAA